MHTHVYTSTNLSDLKHIKCNLQKKCSYILALQRNTIVSNKHYKQKEKKKDMVKQNKGNV